MVNAKSMSSPANHIHLANVLVILIWTEIHIAIGFDVPFCAQVNLKQ